MGQLMIDSIEQNLLKKFIKSEPITKGWSEDKKYCVTKADGTKYLLRITPIARYEMRKSLNSIDRKSTRLNSSH